MTDFITTVRGSDAVSDEDALMAFEVLGPILLMTPDDADAVEAAAKMIGRMRPGTTLAAVLDWWLVVATGSGPAIGHAFHLPDSIPHSLRHAMERVTQLTHQGLPVPPACWVQARRELDRLLARLDHHLALDSYGKSKLPGEREVWAYLQGQLHPVVSALSEGRRTERFDLDERAYEKEMKRSGIDGNSRRWNEMIKRASECVSRVNEVVDVQGIVEPWISRELPPVIEALPAEIRATLGPVSDFVFSSIIEPSSPGGQVDHAVSERTAGRLDEIAAGLDDLNLMWLASVADGWMTATGLEVAPLMAAIRRRDAVIERIERLRSASLDADEAELLLLDHDVVAAERVVERLEERRRQDRRQEALRGALARFRATGRSDGAPAD